MVRRKKYLNSKIVGVTGGIGSGQTTVCEVFNREGCKVINLDRKAKEVINRNKTVQNEIKKEFGENVFYKNRSLNRKLLAQIVFNDESKVEKLNRIVHPRMVENMVEEIETARFSGKFPLIIVDAALIYEIAIEQLFDVVIVVYANTRQRIQRVMNRDKMKKEEILARIDKQIPLEEKKKWADYVIDNRGNLQDLNNQVTKIMNELVD